MAKNDLPFKGANCEFYIDNCRDDSRVGVIGGVFYCVNKQCINYDHNKNASQFDEAGNSMKPCSTRAIIKKGIPVDESGASINLETIEGVRA